MEASIFSGMVCVIDSNSITHYFILSCGQGLTGGLRGAMLGTKKNVTARESLNAASQVVTIRDTRAHLSWTAAQR